jgi:hypothetical protein
VLDAFFVLQASHFESASGCDREARLGFV